MNGRSLAQLAQLQRRAVPTTIDPNVVQQQGDFFSFTFGEWLCFLFELEKLFS